MDATDETKLRVIARLHGDFPTKFGLPRQSGLIDALKATIVFEAPYRNPDAVRGLEMYSHIWLIWGFSEVTRDHWSATVRPPRLGGNTRLGVFATRSPFRPNPIGLSCVRLEGIDPDAAHGPLLRVSGADLMDNTPIYDIKPYLPYVDSRPDARGGFAEEKKDYALAVDCPSDLLALIPACARAALLGVLAGDPRPAYQEDPQRVYGFAYAGCDVRFSVREGRLTVREIVPAPKK